MGRSRILCRKGMGRAGQVEPSKGLPFYFIALSVISHLLGEACLCGFHGHVAVIETTVVPLPSFDKRRAAGLTCEIAPVCHVQATASKTLEMMRRSNKSSKAALSLD